MKKIIFLFLIVNCSLIVDNCLSQWQPDVRLTNDTAGSNTSGNNAWCIASSGSTVHVVWYDTRDGNSEIYYKRSTDAGQNWGADTRLTNNSAASALASIIVEGQSVHVAWRDNRDGNWEIYYKRSTDGGMSWGADTRLSNNSAESFNPAIAVSGAVVHITWRDNRDGNYEVYYKRSSDGGVSWGAESRMTNNSAWSNYPSVSVSGQDVYLIWTDIRDGNWEVYSKRSTDGGVNWGADTRLTNNSAPSYDPTAAASGTGLHIVWSDVRDTDVEIYYKRSTDGGMSWGADTRLTSIAGQAWYPSVSVSGQMVHIIWYDERDGNAEMYYKRSTDGGASWGADTRLTNNSADSFDPSISVSGQDVHIVWSDNRDGNFEIYYKSDVSSIGIININSEIPHKFSLSQNYPNPFNPVTNIEFAVPKSSFVKMTVYDVLGKEIDIIVSENLKAGTYKADWNASKYPSGVYFYKLVTEEFSETKKMMLIK